MKTLEQMEQLGAGVGNTVIDPYAHRKQTKRWCFTLNNYSLVQMEQMEQVLHSLCVKFIFQEEKSESGTNHLQGCFWLKSKRRLTELKKQICNECHYEVCRSWEHSILYCCKEDTRCGRVIRKSVKLPPKEIKVLDSKIFYPWQKEVLSIVEQEPCDRTIYWFWENKGNVGKSALCKHLVVKHNALILSGKSKDMFYGIVKWKESQGEYPRLIIFDVPRSSEGYLNYSGIEMIKNGLFYSPKYESGMCVGNCPHLLIFANFRPDTSVMSEDRWIVRKL